MILESFIASFMAEQERPPLLPKAAKFADRATAEFQQVLQELAESVIRRDEVAHRTALEHAQAYIAGILTLSNLLGRRSILVVSDRMRRDSAAVQPTIVLANIPDVPKVEFVEAIEDIVSREPRLARSAAEVSELYATNHAFAMARSADIWITKRVRDEIGRALQEGTNVYSSAAAIAKIGKKVEGFTQAYAETTFRTNAWTAFTAGEFAQAQDPDVADVVPAFELSAVSDSDTRDNHRNASGLIAATNDPIWEKFAPPLGYNCRCDLIARDVYWLRSRGLIDAHGRVNRVTPPNFSAAYPDPGFGQGRHRIFGV